MDSSRWHIGSPLVTAMLGSAAVGGQFIAGKAARDALFLTNFDTSSLPVMIMVTAIVSIVLVVASSRAVARVAPSTWVPAAFGLAAALSVAEWLLVASAPQLAARTLYFLVSGVGPVLASGFWLIASERFDPHTAKKHFGQIAGAGTLGGLLAGLAAARVAAVGDVRAMLLLLAALNLGCVWLTRQLAQPAGQPTHAFDHAATVHPRRSALRVLSGAGYLRSLAALVLFGTIAETLVDQAFKTHVQAAVGKGPSLGSFFALYYAALSLITFCVQTAGSRYVLEKLGLGVATGTPALMFLVGGAAALLAPGLRSLTLMRGSEAIFRASIYRAGYELFYTPIAPHDKRPVKSLIDVGVDRTGDIVGATLTQQVLRIPQPGQTTVLLSLAMGCAGVALLIASRLTRGYEKALETSLLSRAVELDLSQAEDLTTRTTLMRTLRTSKTATSATTHSELGTRRQGERPSASAPIVDSDIQQIMMLQSGDGESIRCVLRSDRGLSAAVVPSVIPLLMRDDVSHDCMRALRAVAEERVGELIDALTDPNQPFTVRRRLARVFSVCVSQRATDGLLLGLEDLRFEVRYQCGRSLLAITEKNPDVRIDKERIFAFVHREVAVNRVVWENRRLLDQFEENDDRSFLEGLVRDRASQSLAHVFTLLALVLPTEPLRIAFRGLHTDDEGLRGTALEYLESVLPEDIRDRLWPFLEVRRQPGIVQRPREETLANLLRSNGSIRANLEELKARAAARRDIAR
jgi:hypothetical protein